MLPRLGQGTKRFNLIPHLERAQDDNRNVSDVTVVIDGSAVHLNRTNTTGFVVTPSNISPVTVKPGLAYTVGTDVVSLGSNVVFLDSSKVTFPTYTRPSAAWNITNSTGPWISPGSSIPLFTSKTTQNPSQPNGKLPGTANGTTTSGGSQGITTGTWTASATSPGVATSAPVSTQSYTPEVIIQSSTTIVVPITVSN